MAILNRRPGFSTVMSAALILALFAGGLPPLSGVTITSTDGQPAFRLDLCHPVPGINHGIGFSTFPPGNALHSIERPLPNGVAHELRMLLVSRASDDLDPPPPKSSRQYLLR